MFLFILSLFARLISEGKNQIKNSLLIVFTDLMLIKYLTVCFMWFICRFFTIVGSKIIRPDTEYHLSVTSQGYKEPQTLRVSINGTEDAGRVFVKSEEITLINDQTQTIIFDVSPMFDEISCLFCFHFSLII